MKQSRFGLIFERPEWIEAIKDSDQLKIDSVYGSEDVRFSPTQYYELVDSEGCRVVVVAGSLGAPQAAFAVEVLAEFGVEAVVRIGTCGSYVSQFGIGECLLPTAALAEESTSRSYVPKGFQAVADHHLVAQVDRVLKEAGLTPRLGAIHTKDRFKDGGLLGQFHSTELVRRLGCIAVDMETSAFLNVCHIRRLQCVALQIVSDVVEVEDKEQAQKYVERVYLKIPFFSWAAILAMKSNARAL